MINRRKSMLWSLALLAGAFAATPFEALLASDKNALETSWKPSLHAQARMIAGVDSSDHRMVGIQVRLDPGWKTYWRSPGDAGLPPSFNWNSSDNLKSAQVLWPAPQRYPDPYGASIGYHDEVVFPVAIEADDPQKPVKLSVSFDYAVCKDVCIPAEAKLNLELAAGGNKDKRHDALIEDFLRQVPVKGGGGNNKPSVHSIKVDLTSPRPTIEVEADFPAGQKEADLFIEGPKHFYIPMTQKVAAISDSRVKFEVDLTKGDEPKDLQGKILTLTLVSPQGSSEVTRQVE